MSLKKIFEEKTKTLVLKNLDYIDDGKDKIPAGTKIKVNGSVTFQKNTIKEIPYNFISVGGVFTISDNPITSLKGSPEESRVFMCTDTNIESLKYGPKRCKGLYAANTRLKNLDFLPTGLGILDISRTNIESFKGCPEELSQLICGHTTIVSFDYIAKRIETLGWTNNKLTSLVGIEKHILECKRIDFSKSTGIKEGGIGLLLIKGLEGVFAKDCGDFAKAMQIINKYIPQGKAGLLACQDELEDAGLEEFAKL